MRSSKIGKLTANRQIIRLIVSGYLTIGFVILLAAWYSINRIQIQVDETSGLHEEAFLTLLGVESLSNDAAQELFAYVLHGSVEELEEYRAILKTLPTQAAMFASIDKLSKPGNEEELRQFSVMQSAWNRYTASAEIMISEYQNTGEVTESGYHTVEESLDRFTEHLDKLLIFGRAEVQASRLKRDKIISESEILMGTLTALGILALAGVGALVTFLVSGYVRELRQLDDDLLLSSAAMDSTHVGVCYSHGSGEHHVTYVNDALLQMTGYSRDEFLGRNCRFLQGADTNREDVKLIREALETGQGINVLLRNYRKDGSPFWNDLYISPVRSSSGEVTHFIGAMHDVSERHELERQLARSQKMETVGQLAGGVAHDFNNYLTVIQGGAELIKGLDSSTPVTELAEQIIEASSRSAQLTKQLLAFSKRQVMMPQTLDLNRVIRDLDSLLRRTLGDEIDLETVTAGGLGMVNADLSQIEQVILNLVINARDAMPEGGKITIETGNVYLDSEYASRRSQASEGRHIMIAVSDTGTGIPEDVLPNIFEPFYSTKETGGSGLGLSTVQGIVEQSGGSIEVYSEKDSGTTFKVYLPRTVGDVVSASVEETYPVNVLDGVVLVVEDEDMVRDVTCRMIEGLGMKVITATDGLLGLEVLKQRGSEVDVLLTDVMLPNMGGKELADEAQKLFPNLGVLFMSGFTENGIMHHGRLDEGIKLLQKPFTTRELHRKLSVVINQGRIVEFKSTSGLMPTQKWSIEAAEKGDKKH